MLPKTRMIAVIGPLAVFFFSLLMQVLSTLFLKVYKLVVFLKALNVMPFMGLLWHLKYLFCAKRYAVLGTP